MLKKQKGLRNSNVGKGSKKNKAAFPGPEVRKDINEIRQGSRKILEKQ